MKKVLLAVDLCGSSRRILKQALEFLQITEGPLHVFLLKTYLVRSSMSDRVITIHDELQKASYRQLQQKLAEVQKLARGEKITLEAILQMGRPSNVISRFVKERKVDYAILGPLDPKQDPGEDLNFLIHLSCPVVILPLL